MSPPTVLVIAQAEDGTADLVIDALRARGADVARIDTADFSSAFSLAATPDRTDSPGWLRVHGRRIAALADAARQALASLGLHPMVHTGDGAAGLVTAAPFDRIVATASTDHIPPAWISQLAPDGVIVVDLRGSLTGSLLRLTMTDSDIVEGSFLNLPGAFMPMRTRLDSPHRDGESWEQVLLDQRNPHQATTHLNPGLVADNRSLRFMAQLHLAGRRLRGFLRPHGGAELSGRCTDGSWFTAGLHPDDDGLYPVAQGGPQRLWDTVESCHAVWQRLGEPTIERFGVTAYHDPAQTGEPSRRGTHQLSGQPNPGAMGKSQSGGLRARTAQIQGTRMSSPCRFGVVVTVLS